MGYDETFVAILATGIAVLATAIAVGLWDQPYRLRSISAISDRYGKRVARTIWVIVALIMFATSWAIARGVRPTFAVPHYMYQRAK